MEKLFKFCGGVFRMMLTIRNENYNLTGPQSKIEPCYIVSYAF